MTRFIAYLALTLLYYQAFGQERNRHWVYNRDIHLSIGPEGLDLLSGPMVAAQSLGHASMSTTAGDLLFYTSNGTLRSAAGSSIPGSAPLSAFSLMYNALALPLDESAGHYVVFVSGVAGSGLAGAVMTYLVLDPNANNDTGLVLSPELEVLADSVSSVLAATPHPNGVDYWVLTHALGSDAFMFFKTSAAMDDLQPVVSHAGPVISTATWTTVDARFSYNGDLLAVATEDPGLLHVYRFDGLTAGLQPLFADPDTSAFSSVEFSPSGRFLYATDRGNGLQHIYQYDLSSNEPATILASKTSVFELQFVPFEDDLFTQLRLAPDGRIYFNSLDDLNGNGSWLCVIDQPEAQGTACDVQWEILNVGPGMFFTAAGVNQCKRYHDSELSVGVRERVAGPALALWPNPATDGRVWLRNTAQKADHVLVHDGMGRVVRSIVLPSSPTQPLDVSGLASGLYTANLLDGTTPVGQTRLVIE